MGASARCAAAVALLAGLALPATGCGGSNGSPARSSPAARGASGPRAPRRYFNPHYRLHRPYHRYRYAHYVYNDEIGEDIVGARTAYARVLLAFGPPRPVPAADRRDSAGRRCIYYGVISPHGEVSTSEWQFCFRRDGTMMGAFDGEPSDHRPSRG